MPKREPSGYPEAFDQACERQERLDAWAGMAMQAMVAADEARNNEIRWDKRCLAIEAYAFADAMEEQRAKRIKR